MGSAVFQIIVVQCVTPLSRAPHLQMLRRSTDYSFFIKYLPSKHSAFVSTYLLPSYLPYVANIDLLEETIVIYNPSSQDHSMEGYYLHDYHQIHCYTFPSDFILPSQSSVTLYCCPGKYGRELNESQTVLFWKNNDGSLRKKEVLNNGLCCCSTVPLHH
jgi:hypothetical protein